MEEETHKDVDKIESELSKGKFVRVKLLQRYPYKNVKPTSRAEKPAPPPPMPDSGASNVTQQNLHNTNANQP